MDISQHSGVNRISHEHSLATFHKETEPLKDFYAERGLLRTVENQPTIELTTAEIKKALGI